MERDTERMLEIGTVLVLILTAFCFMYYLIIGFNPTVALNPFPPPPTGTPTLAPMATFPPMWTPTATGPPTDTPLPTGTPTITGTPTDTPTMTPTPSITPTITTTPTETDTPAPTDTPTLTPSPTPWPYTARGRGARGYPNADCDWTGVEGHIKDLYDYPIPGVVVKVWWDESPEGLPSNPSDADGRYDVTLDVRAKAGKWYAAVWENGVAVSPIITFQTDTNCNSGVQRVRIDWIENY